MQGSLLPDLADCVGPDGVVVELELGVGLQIATGGYAARQGIAGVLLRR